MMQIMREIQIDAGHRIPNHDGPCCHLHGHRYRIVAMVEGPVVEAPTASEHGMVIDFGVLKRLLMEKIHQPLDHGFLVWEQDAEVLRFLQSQNFRCVIFDNVPTAENLAQWCYKELRKPLLESSNNQLKLKSITIWETPNNSATYTPQEEQEQ